MNALTDKEFMRYSRQLLLEQIGPQGQLRLKQAKVLIVGLGGLGSPAAQYLVAAGVGSLILADSDYTELSNLNRQILFRTSDIPEPKALAAAALRQLNPLPRLQALAQRLEGERLQQIVAECDLVLDCSDNLATRHAVNQAVVHAGKTLISGSAIGFDGQLLVISPPYNQGCYACLCPDSSSAPLNCRTAGVIGPLTGMIGALQALEAIKFIACPQQTTPGKLHRFDGLDLRWQTLTLSPSQQCPICGVNL